jgi:hypothetical protein
MRTLAAVMFALLCAASAQAKLDIRDIQASHGSLGPERKSADYVAGDQVFFRYMVVGIRTDDDGRMRGELRLTVTDAKGKVVTRSESPIQQILPLGGDTLPGTATFDLGTNALPGEYEMTVEVTDLIAKETASFRRKITCKPVEFALTQIRFSYDAAGRAPARVGGTVRQTLYMRMVAVGFDRSEGEIDVVMELQVFDTAGKAMLPKPIRAAVHNEKPEEVKQTERVNLSGVLSLNRPGDFVLRVTVTDTKTQQKQTFETPLRVSAP